MSITNYVFIALLPLIALFFYKIKWVLGMRSFQKFDPSKQYYILPVDENYSSTRSTNWNYEYGYRFAVLQKKGLYWNKTYAIIEQEKNAVYGLSSSARVDLLLNNHASLCNLVSEILTKENGEMSNYAQKHMATEF